MGPSTSWLPHGCVPAVAAGWQSVSEAKELAVGGSGKARPRFLQPSVQFSRSVVSDSLWTGLQHGMQHGLQHASFPCPSATPELTQTHVHGVGDAIQPSHLLSSPSPTFNLSQHQGLFQWISSSSGGQCIGVSASASVLLMNIQDWFPLGWTGLISLQSKGLSKESSPTPQFKNINSSTLDPEKSDRTLQIRLKS